MSNEEMKQSIVITIQQEECGYSRGVLTEGCFLGPVCPWPHLYILFWLSPRTTSPKTPCVYFPLLSAAATNSHSLLGVFFPGVWLQNGMSLPFLSQRQWSIIFLSLYLSMDFFLIILYYLINSMLLSNKTLKIVSKFSFLLSKKVVLNYLLCDYPEAEE